MSGGDLFIVDDNPGDIRLIAKAFAVSELITTIHTVNTRDEALDLIHRRNEYDDAPRRGAAQLEALSDDR